LKTFLFTLKIRHKIPARKFALKAEKKHKAIWCDSESGPWFFGMRVSDNCNIKTESWTSLREAYTNDTGVDDMEFFTGSAEFQVNEIEVFKITD
jgi:NAD+--asparagine ADP-ribosyltransferase